MSFTWRFHCIAKTSHHAVTLHASMLLSLIVYLSPPQTIDFELRKLDAQQAAEHINLLKSFMPNTFLISGGKSVT